MVKLANTVVFPVYELDGITLDCNVISNLEKMSRSAHGRRWVIAPVVNSKVENQVIIDSLNEIGKDKYRDTFAGLCIKLNSGKGLDEELIQLLINHEKRKMVGLIVDDETYETFESNYLNRDSVVTFLKSDRTFLILDNVAGMSDKGNLLKTALYFSNVIVRGVTPLEVGTVSLGAIRTSCTKILLEYSAEYNDLCQSIRKFGVENCIVSKLHDEKFVSGFDNSLLDNWAGLQSESVVGNVKALRAGGISEQDIHTLISLNAHEFFSLSTP
ncbi:hypothetical protein C9J03_25525 [Photobacterium gaetbulicola]|uniref:Uncharacterized protein n=1 Tax=Photobacterium gaetbulicola Gung47 TaxID=658445 RepID=A0A0C5W271_9GAMM|nr:hypothetical protein [Photobacterium gaetbulicola]AJR05496.1 hypothetical protein H744_1c0471 [Photobacterium gaetbulicola Gung47]PST99763.1 hypothetical protein C9J03_25525 [Photobacterium gaetbulicola]